MFCKNCGKPIPDDSKYCPYCGCSCGSEKKPSFKHAQPNPDNNAAGFSTTPPVVQTATSTQDAKMQQMKSTLSQFSDSKLKKMIKFSKPFVVNMILAFVGVLIFFAGAPVTSIIEDPTSVFLNIYQIFMILYATTLIILAIINIVYLNTYKKEFQIKPRMGIITKSICIGLLSALIIVLSLKMAFKATMRQHDPILPIMSMVLIGLNFVTCGLNASTSQMYILLTKKRLAKILPEKKL